jgi:hypothetical protein
MVAISEKPRTPAAPTQAKYKRLRSGRRPLSDDQRQLPLFPDLPERGALVAATCHPAVDRLAGAITCLTIRVSSRSFQVYRSQVALVAGGCQPAADGLEWTVSEQPPRRAPGTPASTTEADYHVNPPRI